MTTARYRVGSISDIAPETPLLASVEGHQIGVFQVGDRYVAWRNVCPHHAAPVCRGTIAGTNLPSAVHEYLPGREGEILQCPWHGWEFDLLTGRHLAAGSRARLRGYPVTVIDDEVYVTLPTPRRNQTEHSSSNPTSTEKPSTKQRKVR